MAAQNKLFQRLIWLADTVYSAKHITMDEIDSRWSKSPYNNDHESRYGKRNFSRLANMRKYRRTMKAGIQCRGIEERVTGIQCRG